MMHTGHIHSGLQWKYKNTYHTYKQTSLKHLQFLICNTPFLWMSPLGRTFFSNFVCQSLSWGGSHVWTRAAHLDCWPVWHPSKSTSIQTMEDANVHITGVKVSRFTSPPPHGSMRTYLLLPTSVPMLHWQNCSLVQSTHYTISNEIYTVMHDAWS